MPNTATPDKPVKPRWQVRLDAYEALLRLDRPIGITLLLWPTLWGLWIAVQGVPNLTVLWVFVLGTVLTRSAGCAINDYADRDIDAYVARTQNRPLAQKLIAPWEALVLAAALALAAFALVLLALKPIVAKLAVLAAIVAAIYPFMKRFFPLPQAWLGIAFSFGIPMAFAQKLGVFTLPDSCWLLMLATWFWIVAYDTEYAMADREDDLKIGVKSSAILFGKYEIAAIVTCYLAFFTLLVVVGAMNNRGPIYYGGLVIGAVFAVFNLRMIRGREPAKCLAAFKQNNWIGLVVFLGVVFDYLPKAA